MHAAGILVWFGFWVTYMYFPCTAACPHCRKISSPGYSGDGGSPESSCLEKCWKEKKKKKKKTVNCKDIRIMNSGCEACVFAAIFMQLARFQAVPFVYHFTPLFLNGWRCPYGIAEWDVVASLLKLPAIFFLCYTPLAGGLYRDR